MFFGEIFSLFGVLLERL